jgi:hypothetical protein
MRASRASLTSVGRHNNPAAEDLAHFFRNSGLNAEWVIGRQIN